jgi:prolipoprotein diacylglyceryl transferase
VLAFIPSRHDSGISIGPLFLHAYGILYAVAVVAAVFIARRRWKGAPDMVDEVALWGFPAGLVGGRLYHVITSWNEVPHTWWGPFAVWKGGLGIWGGIAAGVIVGLWRVRRRGEDVAAFMDAGAPALLVAQSIGRVGNWFNQELFGKPTTLPWGLKIDPEHRPEQYANAVTFHPTSSTRSSGTSRWPASWSGSGTVATSARPASSRSTSRATARSGSSRRRSASIPRTTSSGCG